MRVNTSKFADDLSENHKIVCKRCKSEELDGFNQVPSRPGTLLLTIFCIYCGARGSLHWTSFEEECAIGRGSIAVVENKPILEIIDFYTRPAVRV